MFSDFTSLKITDFILGSFGAAVVMSWRLWQQSQTTNETLDNPILRVLYILMFLIGSGVLATTQGASPQYSALYAGFTAPVFFHTIFKDNAKAEQASNEIKDKNEWLTQENEELNIKLEELSRSRLRLPSITPNLFTRTKRLNPGSSNRQRESISLELNEDILAPIVKILKVNLHLSEDDNDKRREIQKTIDSMERVIALSKKDRRQNYSRNFLRNLFRRRKLYKMSKSKSSDKYEYQDGDIVIIRKSDGAYIQRNKVKYRKLQFFNQLFEGKTIFTILFIQSILLILRIQYPPELFFSTWSLLSVSPLVLLISLTIFRLLKTIREIALESDSFQLFLKGLF